MKFLRHKITSTLFFLPLLLSLVLLMGAPMAEDVTGIDIESTAYAADILPGIWIAPACICPFPFIGCLCIIITE